MGLALQPRQPLALAPLLLLGACGQADAPAANVAAPARPAIEGDVGTAERLVRERLGAGAAGIRFTGARRSASGAVQIICGSFEQGPSRQRYIVVAGEDAFVESQMEAGEMEQAYVEFCGRDGTPPPRPPDRTPAGNAQ
jgi:hypothetical protein